MPDPAKCPYCNQPLVSDAAIKHLHRTEDKLRRKLMAEADAAAKSKIQEACAQTEQRIRDELDEERSKRERSLQQTIEVLQRQNGDLERRLEGLSAPDRGSMNEADIADDLAHAFPDDEIARKGKGGDILQVVRHRADGELEQAGLILYECKDTKRWSNGFLAQIKADGRKRKTAYLMLISRTLPAKEQDVCVRDDVVITDPAHAPHMARVLRRVVIETHRAERAGHNRAEKTARLYEYLRGDDFREHLSAVVEAGGKLSEMLQSERRAHERDWSTRQRVYDELVHDSVALDEAIRAIIESEPAPEQRRATTTRTPSRRRRGPAASVRS